MKIRELKIGTIIRSSDEKLTAIVKSVTHHTSDVYYLVDVFEPKGNDKFFGHGAKGIWHTDIEEGNWGMSNGLQRAQKRALEYKK